MNLSDYIESRGEFYCFLCRKTYTRYESSYCIVHNKAICGKCIEEIGKIYESSKEEL